MLSCSWPLFLQEDCTFACVTRFEKVVKFSKNVTVVRAVLSIVIMVLCMLISTVGLDVIVLKGYGMAGILGIPFVIIPVIAINLFGKKKQVSQTAVNPSMEEEIIIFTYNKLFHFKKKEG